MDNLPLIEKYRPKTFDDIILSSKTLNTLKTIILEDNMPHCLFYGPPGTGKTSTITTIAKYLYGDQYHSMTLELNASDDRGIGVVRDKIINFCGSKILQRCDNNNTFKLVILDEADALTDDAQAGLRRVIEKYTKNCRFCLICNNKNQITPALESRCSTFQFPIVNKEKMMDKIRYICESECINISDNAIKLLIRLAKGDMRKCINIIQMISYDSYVTEDLIYESLGYPTLKDINMIYDNLNDNSFKDAFYAINKLILDNNYVLNNIITEIYNMISNDDMIEPEKLIYYTKRLADLEQRVGIDTDTEIQLGDLISIFT